ncbi:unnamed protein product (macronuclear) [Paramecium tetraurelia]|uniref:UBC core domain-containing protein n=1 Tax=Paramecium tetraurelia TaxID=5888 RepID=A0DMF9_PARTE|nr:uncharacterized protein GSPATT00018444001 [Paramecium tetraurelia]CAK84226.1 unnamed protein product [Paramecium tetraurelia]|eukprot:XP_001451623.1 hypothetical protein (macronuclear) [Paramecium tetraurelia strain d4-2]
MIDNRLEKEFNAVLNAIDDGVLENISVEVDKQNNSINYRKWIVTIYGKEGTIWEGGEFPGFLNFSKSYPSDPPQYYWQLYGGQFQHMNVFENGATCIDILNNKIGYTPATSCVEILKGMEGFLYNPNPKSPTMRGLAKTFEENKEQYEKLIKAFVKHYMIEKEKKKQ